MAEPNYDCSHPVGIDDEPRHHLVIANEFVRAFAVEVAPGDRTLCHHHPHDYLLYVATDAEIVSAAKGEEPKRLSYQDGECELSSAGLTHVVENLGEKPFRNVVVELLPAAMKLRRGVQPSITSGRAQVERLLEEDSGAVFSIAMQPGSEIEIAGPAVLASPYDDRLLIKELEAFDIRLDEFRKLMWVCAPRKVWIRNSESTLARMCVFQPGTADA
jgi:hypothetical protein